MRLLEDMPNARRSTELAASHLRDSSMTVEAVATLLGYYDSAAFRKAFHRWYRQSPAEYRDSVL